MTIGILEITAIDEGLDDYSSPVKFSQAVEQA
jgi:hypothetical protein